jgi:hypothetical protein
MSTHTPHPPTLHVGLVDGCPRCEEHARHPLDSLDHEHLAAFWHQMRRVEADEGVYRSRAERKACEPLIFILSFLTAHLPEVDATVWPPRVRSATH